MLALWLFSAASGMLWKNTEQLENRLKLLMCLKYFGQMNKHLSRNCSWIVCLWLLILGAYVCLIISCHFWLAFSMIESHSFGLLTTWFSICLSLLQLNGFSLWSSEENFIQMPYCSFLQLHWVLYNQILLLVVLFYFKVAVNLTY